MEIKKEKCSLKEHSETNANSYCANCRLFMCNKCENYHSNLFSTHHQTFILEKNNAEIFTGFCGEKEHKHELEFFCKTHNQLCCVECISKIKKKNFGNHKDCEVCLIEDIKDEKLNKLSENIKYLEDLSKDINESINN